MPIPPGRLSGSEQAPGPGSTTMAGTQLYNEISTIIQPPAPTIPLAGPSNELAIGSVSTGDDCVVCYDNTIVPGSPSHDWFNDCHGDLFCGTCADQVSVCPLCRGPKVENGQDSKNSSKGNGKSDACRNHPADKPLDACPFCHSDWGGLNCESSDSGASCEKVATKVPETKQHESNLLTPDASPLPAEPEVCSVRARARALPPSLFTHLFLVGLGRNFSYSLDFCTYLSVLHLSPFLFLALCRYHRFQLRSGMESSG